MNMNPQELLELFQKINNFDKHLNLELNNNSDKLQYSLTIANEHLSSPKTSHGAVIAAMMDAVLGIEALSHAVSKGCLCSTVEFKINYLQPALLGDKLTGHAQIDFKGKSLVVTSATINCGEKLVAKGQGTFNLYPFEKKDFSGFEPLEK